MVLVQGQTVAIRLLPFHDEPAKPKPEDVYLQAVLKRGRLHIRSTNPFF